MKPVWRRILGPGLSVILFTAAVLLLYSELKTYHLKDILNAFQSIPAGGLGAAAALTILSYTVMTGYDALALRYIRQQLAYSKVGLASFIGYAFSNNIGMSMLAGASVRYRLYSAWGLSAFQITQVVAFCTLTLWLGFFTIGGAVFLIEPLTIPAALVIRNERIEAFANLWAGEQREELSLDLMRYLPDAAEGVMEYLFICLMLWGKAQGYRWFNLGLAPFSGLENRALAPLWNRLGAFVFRHGEHFYNFQGLRRYKEKFDPEWRPKYLVSPGGLALPQIFANLATLISGGVKGVVTK